MQRTRVLVLRILPHNTARWKVALLQSMTTMSGSQCDYGSFFKRNIEDLDGDEDVDTLPSRSSSATSRTHPASFFVSLSTRFILRVHPFVRDSVVAREPRDIAVAHRFHFERGRRIRSDRRSSRRLGHRFIDPIRRAVGGCGIGGRAVERFSLLAPACPSGALAVAPAIRKLGSRSCD